MLSAIRAIKERTDKGMEVIEDIACAVAYYFVKALNYMSIVFVVWFILSWAEIAFTLKSPDTIPTYSGWNLFTLIDYWFSR